MWQEAHELRVRGLEELESGANGRSRVLLEWDANANERRVTPVFRQRVEHEVDATQVFVGDDPSPRLLIPIKDCLSLDPVFHDVAVDRERNVGGCIDRRCFPL